MLQSNPKIHIIFLSKVVVYVAVLCVLVFHVFMCVHILLFYMNHMTVYTCELCVQVAGCCVECGTSFGRYYCSVCHLYADEDKGQFHCDKCGLCR